MFDLTGKSALITGASGGIGGAIAKALYAQGATVGLNGRNVAALEKLAAEIGGGDRVFIFASTLDTSEEADALVGEVCAGAYDVAAGWSLRPVEGAVGNVRNNGPELIQEMREQQGTLL